MTTLGFHYFPDELHYRRADLQTWLPELLALDAKWATVIGSMTRAVPEAFIRGLLDAGIEPIIHLPAVPTRPDPQHVAGATLAQLFTSYARWGVRFVAAFAEPNMRAAWAPKDWGQAGLVEHFLDLLVPILDAQVEAGLKPVFPALRAGGDYWDTAFLEASLNGLIQRDKLDLARELVFAANLWTYNRPLDWGKGGHSRWPDARPYLTPPGSQDQRGFHLFDWYDEIIQARLGEQRPFVCLAGGPRLGDQTDPALPATNDLRHASCIQDITSALRDGHMPKHVLNVNLWLLAAGEGSPFAAEAWFRPGGTTLTAAHALKQVPAHGLPAARRRADESKALDLDKVAGQMAGAPEKLLRHYVLLPVFEWGVSDWHWSAALDFVKAHRPACGFSPEEAVHAERVTIVGNEQGVGPGVEASLRQAGCTVDRISVGRGGL
jgi:hypothetical protein